MNNSLQVQLLEILADADAKGASDIHLAPGRKPVFRLAGNLEIQEKYALVSPEDSQEMIYGIMTSDMRSTLDEFWETDFSKDLKLGDHQVRFRINVHKQNRGLAAVLRLVPYEIKTPEEIGLEETIKELTQKPRGLILVTGPTGCGKSTTLATMIDMINQRDSKHILTIEDPIEFVHREQSCVITQRELGTHTHSFTTALKSALREDPDIILVGEMRDNETISLALTAAETGHLVFATLHTTDAAQTVDRIVDVFDSAQQAMVRTQLSSVLEAVVCQVILKRDDDQSKRVVAREILLATTAIRSHIRQNETQKIYPAITVGVNTGMCPLELSLVEKVTQGFITADSARKVANNRKQFENYLSDSAKKRTNDPFAQEFEEEQPGDSGKRKFRRWRG